MTYTFVYFKICKLNFIHIVKLFERKINKLFGDKNISALKVNPIEKQKMRNHEKTKKPYIIVRRLYFMLHFCLSFSKQLT